MTAAQRDGEVTLNGLRAHYAEWGSPSAPVLVALHGLRSYAETFEDLATALPAFRVIALDHRGRGRSDWDPQRRYDTLTYVADLEAFADALGLDRFHLLGHSMGGANAIAYAGTYPARVASLIVEEMAPGATASSEGSARIARELASTPASFPDRAAAAAFWRSIRPNVTEDAIGSRVRHTLKEDAGGSLRWRYDVDGIAAARSAIAPLDLWPYLEAVTAPILLVRGANSTYVSDERAAEMAARCSNLRRADIPDATHYVHDDQPEAFARAVAAFLRDLTPAPAR